MVVDSYEMIDFYEKYHAMYGNYLKPEIVSIAMIQTKDEVYLQVTKVTRTKDGYEKTTKETEDMSFISDIDENVPPESIKPYFSIEDSIEVNVDKFINGLTPYDIINCFNLFTDEASEKISRKYNIFEVNESK